MRDPGAGLVGRVTHFMHLEGRSPAQWRQPLQATDAKPLEGFVMAYEIDLSGRVALVTGASGGLGAQFAKTLA